MAEPPGKKPIGKQPPRPMQMNDSVAHVAVMRPQKRKRDGSELAKENAPGDLQDRDTDVDPAKPHEPVTPGPAISQAPARLPATAAVPASGAGPTLAPPERPDISRREAEQLIKTQITPFVAALKTDYSAQHVVFSERAALDDALGKAQRIVRERREIMAERLAGYAGPNVERVEEAWDDAMVILGEIYLQEDHWAAEPESLIGEWRQTFLIKPGGERVGIVFYLISSHALRPRAAAQEIEQQILVPAIEAILALVDWTEAAAIGRAITEAEAKRIDEHRTRLSRAVTGLSGPQRAHYLAAYHGALGAVATGDPENRFRSCTEDPRLVALWIDLAG